VVEERLQVRSGSIGSGGPTGVGLGLDKVEISAAALEQMRSARASESASDSELPPELQEKARIV